MAVRVLLERGRTRVFASALDWPGWARSAKGDEAALAALEDYAARYRAVAGDGFAPGPLEVVAAVPGTSTTDFGAPDVVAPGEAEEPLDGAELERWLGLLEASWAYLDGVVARAPEVLRKGPRGGGRDRDEVRDHVREAERAYARKLGARVPPHTPWEEQRAALLAAARAGGGGGWPLRYALRRLTWHVLDHAWEIEDKS